MLAGTKRRTLVRAVAMTGRPFSSHCTSVHFLTASSVTYDSDDSRNLPPYSALNVSGFFLCSDLRNLGSSLGFISALGQFSVKMPDATPSSSARRWSSYILPIFLRGEEIDRIMESWTSTISFLSSNSRTLSSVSSKLDASSPKSLPYSCTFMSCSSASVTWWKSPVDGVAAAYMSSEVLPLAERKWANSSSARNTDDGERTAFVVQGRHDTVMVGLMSRWSRSASETKERSFVLLSLRNGANQLARLTCSRSFLNRRPAPFSSCARKVKSMLEPLTRPKYSCGLRMLRSR